jgi:hypothetical protein
MMERLSGPRNGKGLPAGLVVKFHAAIAALFLLATPLMGQWTLNVNMPSQYPSAFISDWEHNPGIVNVWIRDSGPLPATVRMETRLYLSETFLMASGTSADIVFRGPFPQGVIRDNRDFWNYRNIQYSSEHREQVGRTGRLMEGNYLLIVKLVDVATGNQLGPERGVRFYIPSFSPPELVAPPDHDTLYVPFPLFQWTRTTTYNIPVQYTVRICKIGSLQTPQVAIRNVPHYSATLTNQTTFAYPVAAPVLEQDARYVWQVTADRGGASGLRTFRTGRNVLQRFPVAVTVPVPLCHSPYLEDYVSGSGALRAQLRSNSNTEQRVRLRLTIFGETHGIRVESDSQFRPQAPLILEPGASLDLSPEYLNQYFSIDSGEFPHLEFHGIRESLAMLGSGLPEGTYRLCVRALDYVTGEPLSAAVPGGSCLFEISQFNPPVIVSPMDGSEVDPSQPQSVLFVWRRPGDVANGRRLEYRFRVVGPLSDSESPDSAVRTRPAYIARTITDSTILLFRPGSDTKRLRVGDRYALQVQVRDIGRAGGFRDLGWSRVTSFRYGRLIHFEPAPLRTTVTGRLVYRFADTLQNTVALPPAGVQLKLTRYYILDVPGLGSLPLRGVPGFSPQILATTQTEDYGLFTFRFASRDTMREIASETTITLPVWPYGHYRGRLRTAARVVSANWYYLSPEEDVTFRAGESLGCGMFVSHVRGYGLTVTVRSHPYYEGYGIEGGPLAGMMVYVLRTGEFTPEDALPSEVRPDPPQEKSLQLGDRSFEVVGQGRTDTEGRVRFYSLVRNASPNDRYYIYADTAGVRDLNFATAPRAFSYRRPPIPSPPVGAFKNDYQHPYQYPDTSCTLYMVPQRPLISGQVYLKQGIVYPAPAPGVSVRLILRDAPGTPNLERQTCTDDSGRFAFELDCADTAYHCSLRFSHPGYNTVRYNVNAGNKLEIGQRVHIERQYLEPGLPVEGYVVDEEGRGVNSWVTFWDGTVLDARVPTGLRLPGDRGAHFSGLVQRPDEPEPPVEGRQGRGIRPRYSRGEISVDPYSTSFFAEDAYYEINGTGICTVTVHRRLHRLSVRVLSSEQSHQPIAGARVQIEEISPEKLTSSSGLVEFTPFASSGNEFTVRVSGPAGQDYVAKRVAITLRPTRGVVSETINLSPGTSLSGQVTASGTPVESARVFFDRGASFPIEAYTDASGRYVLHGVPVLNESLPFRAVKTGYIGARRRVWVAPGGQSTQDFALQQYGDLDLTRLLGFPIEVESLSGQGQSAVIWGAFVRLRGNPQFRVMDSSFRLGFTGIPITADTSRNGQGVPFARPVSLPVLTNQNRMRLDMMERLHGHLEAYRGPGIVVDTFGAGAAVKGRPKVDAASYADQSVFFFGGGFYLAHPGTGMGHQRVPALTAPGTEPLAASHGFPVTDSLGHPLDYRLCGFRATARRDGSRLRGDRLDLPTAIHWGLGHESAPCSLDIGAVRLFAESLAALRGSDTFYTPLESWRLVGSGWWLDGRAGFRMNGFVDIGSLNVPFTELYVLPQDSTVRCTKFRLDEITVGGVLPLTFVSGSEARFGWDEGKGHWGLCAYSPLTGEPTAAFTNLPGLNPSDSIVVDNIFLLSDGTEGVTLVQDRPVTLRHLVKFTPVQIVVNIPGAARFRGGVDLRIPDAPGVNGSITFTRKQGDLQFNFDPVDIQWNVLGATIRLPGTPQFPQSLIGGSDRPGGPFVRPKFSARGIVYELAPNRDSVFAFTVSLRHTWDSTWVVIDSFQKFYFAGKGSSRYLDGQNGVTGGMKAKNGAWSNFRFDGDLHNCPGVAAERRHLYIIVKGNVESDGSQTIGVDKIATPFGDLRVTFDFEHQRLVGTLDIDKDLGGCALNGIAEFLADRDGWYFFGGFRATLPIGFQGNLATLIGHYPMTNDLHGKFMAYSLVYERWHRTPVGFPEVGSQISGFFLEGGVVIPVLPNLSFNFWLIEGHITCNVGADYSLGLNFAGEGTRFSTGFVVFGEASIGVSASCVIVCAGAELSGELKLEAGGYYASSSDWQIKGDASVTCSGTAYFGTGVCITESGGGCGSVPGCPIPCVSFEWEGAVTLGFGFQDTEPASPDDGFGFYLN